MPIIYIISSPDVIHYGLSRLLKGSTKRYHPSTNKQNRNRTTFVQFLLLFVYCNECALQIHVIRLALVQFDYFDA